MAPPPQEHADDRTPPQRDATIHLTGHCMDHYIALLAALADEGAGPG